VKSVSYKKVRTQEPGDEPLADQCVSTGHHKLECILSLREIYIKSRVATVQSPCGLDPCATCDRTT